MTTPTPDKGGRPRDPAVQTRPGTCPVHGTVEFRLHKVGFDHHGTQRYRARCPECHAARNNHKETP